MDHYLDNRGVDDRGVDGVGDLEREGGLLISITEAHKTLLFTERDSQRDRGLELYTKVTKPSYFIIFNLREIRTLKRV